MANRSISPGTDAGEAIESRRSPQRENDQATGFADSVGAETSIDLPDMGELSPESARPSPLDDIAEAERENAPRD